MFTIMCTIKNCSFLIIGFVFLESKVTAKICDGGHSCSGPMTCCNKGCCYTNQGPGTMISGAGTSRVYTGVGPQLLMPVHWYFWALLAACLAAIICLCALWRRRTVWSCCRDSGQDRRSEPDSNGSLYAPPHYSRCSSFHHAPPPYTEVATKPDMYPLVIGYGLGCENNFKAPSTNYLMVQYFHNYIFQPTTGSISATSTVDSLSSAFICTSNNDFQLQINYDSTTIVDPTCYTSKSILVPFQQAQFLQELVTQMYAIHNNIWNADPMERITNIIPPPYSCTGSFEECSLPNDNCVQDATTNSPQPTAYTYSDIVRSDSGPLSTTTTAVVSKHSNNNNTAIPHQKTQQHCNNEVLDTSYHVQSSSSAIIRNNNRSEDNQQTIYIPSNQYNFNNNSEMPNNDSDSTISWVNNMISGVGSHSQTTSVDRDFDNPELVLDQTSYSVANSITGSDISSLTNLGTPDSPPRATSPTVEIREILNKIQQLPQQKSPITVEQLPSSSSNDMPPPLMIPQTKTQQTFLRTKRCFTRSKIKTLYVPLTKQSKTLNFFDVGGSKSSTKRWLSRSAPTTPCSVMLPTFPSQRKSSANASRRGSKTGDGSPLLLEQESSDEETRKSEHV